jgi:hypothetical protein
MQAVNVSASSPDELENITNEQLIVEALSSNTDFAGIFEIPPDPFISTIVDAMELFPRSSLFGYRNAMNKSYILDKDRILAKMGYPLRGSGDLYITDSRGLCKNSPTDEDAIIRMQKARDANIPIVMFFGGSTVMGEGAKSPCLSIPAQVEKILRENGRETACINFGLLGTFSYTSLLFLVTEGLVEKPSVVIFYDGWNCLNEFKLNQLLNESKANFPIKTFAGPYLNIHQVKNDIELNRYFNLPYMISKVTGIITAYFLALMAKISPFQSIKAFMSQLTIKIWDAGLPTQNKIVNLVKHAENQADDKRDLTIQSAKQYIQTHIFAKKFTEALGSKYITILQPLLFWGAKNLTENEAMYLQNSPHFLDKQDYLLFHEAIKKQGPEVNLQDFTDVFDQTNEEVYYDEGHINSRGNFIVATRISKYLLNHL